MRNGIHRLLNAGMPKSEFKTPILAWAMEDTCFKLMEWTKLCLTHLE